MRSDDPRFGSLVKCLAADAANAEQCAELLRNRRTLWEPMPLRHVRELADGIQQAATLSTERELATIVSAVLTEEPCRAIVFGQLGWDGTGVHPVSDVAQEFGCSVQRVYVWRNRLLGKLAGGKPFAPTLDRVLSAVEAFVPGPVGPAEEHLLSTGLTERRFDLSGLQTASNALGRPLTFAVKDGFLVTPNAEQAVRNAVKTAKHIVCRTWSLPAS